MQKVSIAALLIGTTVAAQASIFHRAASCIFRSLLPGKVVAALPVKANLKRLRLETGGYQQPGLKVGDFVGPDGNLFLFRKIIGEYDPNYVGGTWKSLNGFTSYSLDPYIHDGVRSAASLTDQTILITKVNIDRDPLYYSPLHSKPTVKLGTSAMDKHRPLSRDAEMQDFGAWDEVAIPNGNEAPVVAAIPQGQYERLLEKYTVSSEVPTESMSMGVRRGWFKPAVIFDHEGFMREATTEFALKPK